MHSSGFDQQQCYYSGVSYEMEELSITNSKVDNCNKLIIAGDRATKNMYTG